MSNTLDSKAMYNSRAALLSFRGRSASGPFNSMLLTSNACMEFLATQEGWGNLEVPVIQATIRA